MLGFAPHSVALHAHNPAKGERATTAVFVLYDSGACTVNRGYLLDSGAFPTDDYESLLDAALDSRLPGNERASRSPSPGRPKNALFGECGGIAEEAARLHCYC
jgi:hypothetical protein